MNSAADTTTVHLITVKGEDVVVKPLSTKGTNTLIAYIKGGRVATRWIASSRIRVRD
ncbi:hypothetical protein SEA_GARDENSTATE_72 [Microbacterium phage GardenState]|uniref:Uncharacterized protein n=2 Tax=Gardenstatevirus TaxID=3425012 RepID=A0A4Y6E913_9CAUD|nr:hypothetical protein SEA_IAMGROOT_71 [Microbacterium phage IAmGroot]QOI66984.1 hypothetical protein SEA_GARDENSTATE_72 [Microbacterium phage GardenState]